MPLPTPEVLWFPGLPTQGGHPQTPLFGCWPLSQLHALRDTEKKNQKLSVTVRCKPSELHASYPAVTPCWSNSSSTDRTTRGSRPQRRHAQTPFGRAMTGTRVLWPHAYTGQTYRALWRTGRPQLRPCGRRAVAAWRWGRRENSAEVCTGSHAGSERAATRASGRAARAELQPSTKH